ncbi:MAG TPA: hypothetical protein PLY67_00110 [Clostridiales bacterium]|nr:hypothetical protein [Clostridiales bacterium]
MIFINKTSKSKIAATILAAAVGAYFAIDIFNNLSIRPLPHHPKSNEGSELIHELLLYLENPALQKERGFELNNENIIAALKPAKKYIDGRYDCQDFIMQSLLRIQYSHIDTIRLISPEGAQMIEDIFLNAKYWMTEPGEDSMCYWSENHQILYGVAEYLAGQMCKDRIFTNDGADGKEHMERGRRRINYWMEQRFLYGFSEYNSTNYYLFDVGPAANFIEFAAPEDADMVERMKMCLDLLLFDVASNMHKFTFTAPTGRAYANNMVGITGDSVSRLIDFLWQRNDNYKTDAHKMLLNFYSMYFAKHPDGTPKKLYEFPRVLYEIGLDEEERVIKSSHSMDTWELEEKGYVGHSDKQIMRQLSMEAFTNPEVIYNTVSYFDKHNLFSNSFVNYFKAINLKLLRHPDRLRFISEKLNPMPNGIALQRANLYCYQTKHYQLMNVQRYHPGIYGATQMLQVLNFGGKSVVFTTHPAKNEDKKSASAYPGYWAGFGRSPHAVQHKNVLLMLYKIPKTPGFLELYSVPQFSHTYLPEAFLDEVEINGRYAFVRHGKAFLAIIGKNELHYKPFSMYSAKALKNGLKDYPDKRFDLIQEGNYHYWIYELSDEDKESFEEFKSRIMENSIEYDGSSKLVYKSQNHEYKTVYGGAFFVDGEEQPLEYERFESDYCHAKREADEFFFSFKGHYLRLNFDKAIREYGEASGGSEK